ncbi:MAG: DUF3568 family protein [Verrucomicrobia bacterium]|nr:DUF3568 family protein [Verrucomicrobiota bacterium]
MKIKHLLLASSLTLAAALFTGCVAPLLVAGAAGAGGYAYTTGKLVFTEAVTLDNAFKASEKALKDLELTPEGKQKDTVTAKMEAKTAKDQTVRIDLEKKGEKITEIRIRVGVFGDEAYSRKIYERIKANL